MKLMTLVFASEIAWRCLESKMNVSLDEILCNPTVALEFDKIAARYALGTNHLSIDGRHYAYVNEPMMCVDMCPS